jgi:hypothetical protein
MSAVVGILRNMHTPVPLILAAAPTVYVVGIAAARVIRLSDVREALGRPAA